MRNPPRRSRPKKPGATIDLESTARPSVGYPGPVSGEPASGEPLPGEPVSREPMSGEEDPVAAADPEDRLAGGASTTAAAAPRPAGDDAPADGGPADGEAGRRRPAAARVFPAGLEDVDAPAAMADAGVTPAPSAAEAFARDEGLAGTGNPRPHGDGEGADYDEDTVLAAAEPDLGARDEDASSGPPAPSYDYNTPSVAPDPRGGGGGFGTAFGAALLGAAVALGAAGILQYAGLLPSVGAAVPPEALQQYARTGDVQQVSADLGVVRDQVAQLQSAQAAGGAGTGVTSAELTAVADRVGALEQRSAAPAAPAPAAAPAPDNTAATAARDAAAQAGEKAEAARLAADKAGQAIAEVQRIAAAAAETAGAARQAAEEAGDTAGASQKSAAAAETAATQAAGTAGAALKAAEGAQGTAGAARQAATAAEAAAAAAAGTAAALGPRMARLEDSSRRAGIALSAAGLKTAVDRGGPFMGELETFASVAGDSPAIATLRGFAAVGVPSAPALAAEWPQAQGTILKALTPLDTDAAVGDQILGGLGSLFSVRPSGTPAASVEGPEAAVARLDAPMRTGDLQGWLAEWETLPQAAKDASRAFRERVAARIETDRVVGDSVTKAVSSAATPG